VDAFLENIQKCSSIEESKNILFSQLNNKPSEATLKALEIAIKAHIGQIRKSGEPYIVHPILVASITAFISGDETMVQAALLHDVIEDTLLEISDIEKDF